MGTPSVSHCLSLAFIQVAVAEQVYPAVVQPALLQWPSQPLREQVAEMGRGTGEIVHEKDGA